jgi:nucleotide-binding universal stress UspA family protein
LTNHLCWAPDSSGFDFAVDARKTLEEAVTETPGAPPSIPVTISVIDGHPAPVLVDASRSADLLVAGSHGRGAFTGMLLGSVSQLCAQHARCPVLVYRHPPDSATNTV